MHKRGDSKPMEKKRKKTVEKSYPVALTIAGSDSGGGAGIQADLRTFNAFGVFGCSAITAITSQNPRQVTRIDMVPPEGVYEQIKTVAGTLDIACAKSGMLGSAGNVDAIISAVKEFNLKLICDPVMISTSRSKLLAEDAAEKMTGELFPLAAWITPNIPEAEFILGRSIVSLEDMKLAAGELYERFGCAVWLKGGHIAENAAKGIGIIRVYDIICVKGKLWKISSLMADVPKYTSHGTGCTLSAALAASLALEMPWKEAACESRAFVLGSLIENIRIGNGIHAMYPPGNDYMSSIQLEEIDS